MSSLTAASKPSTKYSLQLIGRKLPAPSRLRRSLDSSISSPGSNGAAPAAATRRNASLSSSSTSSAAAANDKLNSASTKAAAWVWHQRGVGEPVAPTKRVQQRPGSSSSSSSSSESSSPSHMPKSRFFAESIKARAAVMPPTALFDAFELSSLRYQMAQLVGRLHEDAPAAEEHNEGEERLQEHEAGAEAADLHVNKPMEAELQASCTKGGGGYPLQRGPKVRHASLDEDAYYEEVERPARIGGSFRSGVSAGAGANQKSHSSSSSSSSSSSLAKPFSAIHKLFQKISKAVKSPSSRRGDTSQYANVHEGLDQHYHYHHYHHHHYHHYNYDLEEEGCGPDEAFAMARRRRFSDSAGVVVYGGEARGQPGQAEGQTSPMTTWGLPAAASSEEAGSPAGCAVPPPSGAAGEPALRSTKSGHGASVHSSRLRLPQRKSVKPTSLQLGSQKAAEMAPSATRLRRLSDSLSDRQAALLQLDLARSMKTSFNSNNYSNQASAAGAAPSRRRHSGTFSAVKAY